MANTITLSPVKDTFTSPNYPSTNFTTSAMLKSSVKSSNTLGYVSYISFDLSSIAGNKTINSIVLRLLYAGLYSEKYGVSLSPTAYSNKQIVARVRRVKSFTTIEPDTLTYNTAITKAGLDNPYATPNDTNDTSVNIQAQMSNYVAFSVKDLTNSNCILVAPFVGSVD